MAVGLFDVDLNDENSDFGQYVEIVVEQVEYNLDISTGQDYYTVTEIPLRPCDAAEFDETDGSDTARFFPNRFASKKQEVEQQVPYLLCLDQTLSFFGDSETNYKKDVSIKIK